MYTKPTKDLSIETLRGLAILLVVAGYVIDHEITRELGHSTLVASALRFSYFILTPIRMPLFTVISAFLYAGSPATRETYRKLITGKTRRIMIPFLAVSTIQYLTFALLPMRNSPALGEIFRIYVWPHEQLWFLYSIFEVFIIVGVLDVLKLMNTPKKWLACLLVSLALHLLLDLPGTFSIRGTNYLMPFFILGYGFRRYSDLLFSRRMLQIYLGVGVLSLLFRVVLFVRPFLEDQAYLFASLVMTFSTVPLLFYVRRPIAVFAWLGYFAFGIHIFNRIFVSATRSIFEHFGFQDTAVQFVLYVTCGVLFAILVQHFFEKFHFTRRFILGMKGRAAGAP